MTFPRGVRVRFALLSAVVILQGCASARVGPAEGFAAPGIGASRAHDAGDAGKHSGPGGPAWTWHATLRGGDAVDVGVIDLRLCFAGRPPLRVGPENPLALPFLVGPPRAFEPRGAGARGATGRPVAVDDTGLVTAGLPPGSCIAFSLDLERATAGLQRLDLALRTGRVVIASPDIWLWRPKPWPAGSEGALVVDVADDAAGSTLAAPFAPGEGGALRVPPSTYRLQAYSAFGRLRDLALERAGARLRVVVTGDDAAVDDATLLRWLAVAVDDVAVPLARFPVDDALVIAAPLWGTRPIAAGFLGRGGGRASAVLLLGRQTAATVERGGGQDDANDDGGRWVLTHELSHALLPPVARGDAWLNEGLATWHQEILPARAGRRRADEARRQLALGFRTGAERARQDGLTLSRACAEMDARGTYQHCYWGGAALAALVADDVGDEAMTALVAALHASGPLDAPPQSALALLGAIAAGEHQAARAARRLIQRWQAARDVPFPDVTAWLAATSGSASSAVDPG